MSDRPKIHIKHQLNGFEYNVFAETPEDAVCLMAQLLIASGEYQPQPSPVLDQVRQVAAVAATRPEPAPQATPAPAPQPKPQAKATTVSCPQCSATATLKQWTDKQSGQTMQRYKCFDCNVWVGPAL